MNQLNKIITNKVIPQNEKLNYLIVIPCVNRDERNAVNIIDETFNGLTKSGMFESDINFKIILFESGSNDVSYLDFIKEYQEKYPNKIKVILSNLALNGNTNTFRMFLYLSKMSFATIDFIIWLDDDIFVCKNFIKNADAWIKKCANFSLFSSLYVPYNSYQIGKFINFRHSKLHEFYGTCCTIFKPELIKYPLKEWFHKQHNAAEFNPDVRFRESIRKYFFRINKICVSYPSLVQHMNIGSSIYKNKKKNKGHTTTTFVGEDIDPKFYEQLL